MNRYEFLEKIGSGKNGEVYRSIDLKQKKEVAIKILCNDDEALEEISNQKIVSSYLYNVPKIYDVFENRNDDEQNKLYLVQELIVGRDLVVVYEAEKNWDMIWATILHVLETAKKLHENNFVHNDLSPVNCMWTGKSIMLIDFEDMKIGKDIIGFCSDYKYFLSSIYGFFWNAKFTNLNVGYERFLLLLEDSELLECNIDYGNNLIKSYKHIDKMTKSEIKNNSIFNWVAKSAYHWQISVVKEIKNNSICKWLAKSAYPCKFLFGKE